MSFKFEIKEKDNTTVLSLIGKVLTDESILNVKQLMNSHIEGKNSNIIFNFSQLTHINSTGINFIMKSLTKARIHNGDLVLFGICGTIENLFKITKLNEIYTIYTSEEEAVNHFKK
ncbi:MAG: STAS domain-containing protein [Flavobacteriia bacterium]|nr:STAS domain-containing protein [Flavobacteriia bacterium]